MNNKQNRAFNTYSSKQRGAVEACWAHNSEVGGSKPFAAIFFCCCNYLIYV